MLFRSESILYSELEEKIKTQNKVVEEYKEKLSKATKNVEQYKAKNSQQIEKIKELKKERDSLNINILKQRQIFTEKCENYQESRARLRTSLKQKDNTIFKLQKVIEALTKKDLCEESYSRLKSLENTVKSPIKDINSIVQLDDFPSELKMKLEKTIEFNTKIYSENVPHNTKRENICKKTNSDNTLSFDLDEVITGTEHETNIVAILYYNRKSIED